MPTYEFECQTCFARHEVIMKMSEIGEYSRVCKQPNQEGRNGGSCDGDLVQVYDKMKPANTIFLGGGWTPKFGPVNRG